MYLKIRRNSIKKVIAVLVANCFLFSFCFAPAVSAALEANYAARQYKQIFKNFTLPYSYGKITDSNFTNSDRVVISVQDLHCHPQVQKNIANIIELFDKSCGVKNVYLEGAFGDVDTSWLSFIGASDNQKLLESMLETGRLTGAEYFSALKRRYGLIKGLEEKDPYLKNLKTFGKILEEQEEINAILAGIEESMLSLKTKYYNSRQFKLEKLFKKYSENKISQRKYYSILQKHTEKLGIGLYKYQNTLTYLEMLEAGQKLDYKAAGRQLQGLISSLKERIPYGAYKMLLDSTANFSEADKLYGYLINITRKFEIDLTVNFPQLNEYFKYIELSQKINPLELIDEEQRLKDEINMRFSDTKAQREIAFLISFQKCLKEFLSGKITASDYEYYKNNIEKFQTLYVKYVDNKVLALLDGYIRRGLDFYEINLDRNKYFAKQLKIDGGQLAAGGKDKDAWVFGKEEIPHFDGKLATQGQGKEADVVNSIKGRQIDIVITGGFHTQGVSKILKDANISYLVITPNVSGGLKEAEETYYRIAKEQSKISYQALANLITSMSLADQIKITFSVSPETAVKLYGQYITTDNKVAVGGIEILKLVDGRYEEPLSNENPPSLSAARRRIIEFAKAIQSDDETQDVISAVMNEVKDLLPQHLAGKVNRETLEKADPIKLAKALDNEDAKKLKILVEAAADDKNPLITKINLFLTDIENIASLNNSAQAQKEADEDFNGQEIGFEKISSSLDTDYLVRIINAKKVSAIFKFAAFNRLGQLKKTGQSDYDLNPLGKILAMEARPLLKSYIDDKNNGKIFKESPYRDSEIGAIAAAAIINLKHRYPKIIPDRIEMTFKEAAVVFDYNTVAAITSRTRYKDNGNTTSIMIFGDLHTKRNFNILLFLIAHEFTHNIQKDGVEGIENVEFPYIQNVNAAIAEIHADAAGMLLAADLDISFEDFREEFEYTKKYDDMIKVNGRYNRAFVGRYNGARSFLEGLIRYNGGDLSAAQSAKLVEAVLDVIIESAEEYKKYNKDENRSEGNDYFGGSSRYFEKILSKWAGADIVISDDTKKSKIGGYIPSAEIFEQAVKANKENIGKYKTGEAGQSYSKKSSGKRIVNALLVGTLLFTLSFTNAACSSVIEAYPSAQTGQVDDGFFTNQKKEEIFRTLQNTPLALKDMKNLEASIQFSAREENSALIDAVFAKYKIDNFLDFEKMGMERPQVLFLDVENGEELTGFAMSLNNLNAIVMAKTRAQQPFEELAAAIAHEAAHIKNADKVANGQITLLEDEIEAYQATALYAPISQEIGTIEIEINGKMQKVDKYQGQLVLAFRKIVSSRAEILESFKGNPAFEDIYYNDIKFVQGEEGLIIISLYNMKNGERKNFVFDVKDQNDVKIVKDVKLKYEYSEVNAVHDEIVSDGLQLSMTWLVNFLKFFGIKQNSGLGKRIILNFENPIIIAGLFFPVIRKWFVARHYFKRLDNLRKREFAGKLQEVENAAKAAKQELFNRPSIKFHQKLAAFAKTLLNKDVRKAAKEKHREVNDSKEEKAQPRYPQSKLKTPQSALDSVAAAISREGVHIDNAGRRPYEDNDYESFKEIPKSAIESAIEFVFISKKMRKYKSELESFDNGADDLTAIRLLADIRRRFIKDRPLISKGNDAAFYQRTMIKLDAMIAERFDAFSYAFKKRLFNDSEIKYLNILNLAVKGLYGQLRQTANDESRDIKERLFAVIQLGQNVDNSDFSDIAEKFLELIKSRKIRVQNDYDLKAALAGVHLTMADVIKEISASVKARFPEFKNPYSDESDAVMYNAISKAVIIKAGRSKESNSDMQFSRYFSSSIFAMDHELWHNYLTILGYDGYDSMDAKTMHEFFAYLSVRVMGSLIGRSYTYKDFSTKKKINIFKESGGKSQEIEEHEAAIAFLNAISSALQTADKIHGLSLWKIVAQTTVFFANTVLESNSFSQREMFEKFVEELADRLEAENMGISKQGFIDALKKYERRPISAYLLKFLRDILYSYVFFGKDKTSLALIETNKINDTLDDQKLTPSKPDKITMERQKIIEEKKRLVNELGASGMTEADLRDDVSLDLDETINLALDRGEAIEITLSSAKNAADIISLILNYKMKDLPREIIDSMLQIALAKNNMNVDKKIYLYADQTSRKISVAVKKIGQKYESKVKKYTNNLQAAEGKYSERETDEGFIISEFEYAANLKSEFKSDEESVGFQLTMTWLVNFLKFFGIKQNSSLGIRIILNFENPIIIAGLFFPIIRKWFVARHNFRRLDNLRKKEFAGKLQEVENAAKAAKRELFNRPSIKFHQKLAAFAKTLLNKDVWKAAKEKHREVNNPKEEKKRPKYPQRIKNLIENGRLKITDENREVANLLTDEMIDAIVGNMRLAFDNENTFDDFIIKTVEHSVANQKYIQPSYDMLSDIKISFKNRVPILFVENRHNYFSFAYNNIICISNANLEDAQEDGKTLALAFLLAHENYHIDNPDEEVLQAELHARNVELKFLELYEIKEIPPYGKTAERVKDEMKIFKTLLSKNLQKSISGQLSQNPKFYYEAVEANFSLTAIYDANQPAKDRIHFIFAPQGLYEIYSEKEKSTARLLRQYASADANESAVIEIGDKEIISKVKEAVKNNQAVSFTLYDFIEDLWKESLGENEYERHYKKLLNIFDKISKELFDNISDSETLFEMLKNAFVNGNHLDETANIYMYIDASANKLIVANALRSEKFNINAQNDKEKAAKNSGFNITAKNAPYKTFASGNLYIAEYVISGAIWNEGRSKDVTGLTSDVLNKLNGMLSEEFVNLGEAGLELLRKYAARYDSAKFDEIFYIMKAYEDNYMQLDFVLKYLSARKVSLENKKPSFNDSYEVQETYFKELRRIEDIIVSLLNNDNEAEVKRFFGEETAYLYIIKNRDSQKYLEETVSDASRPILRRLNALMYLKAKFPFTPFDYNDLLNEFMEKLKSEIAQVEYDNNLNIKNNYELRAYITGIHSILAPTFDGGSAKFAKINEEILEASFLNNMDAPLMLANSGLFFGTYGVSAHTIAHELGHKYFSILSDAILSYKTVAEQTWSEFYADMTAELFNSILGVSMADNIVARTFKQLFYQDVLSDKDIDRYSAETSFIWHLQNSLKHIKGAFDAKLILETAVYFVRNNFSAQDSQKETFEKFIEHYAKAAADKMGTSDAEKTRIEKSLRTSLKNVQEGKNAENKIIDDKTTLAKRDLLEGADVKEEKTQPQYPQRIKNLIENGRLKITDENREVVGWFSDERIDILLHEYNPIAQDDISEEEDAENIIFESIEITFKNQKTVQKAYELLKSKGINFSYDISKVPVVFVKSDSNAMCLAAESGDVIYLSSKILETQKGKLKTPQAALNSVAAAISHEGVHVDNAGKRVNYFKNEAQAYLKQVEFMRAANLKEASGMSLKDLERTGKAFEILSSVENMKIINGIFRKNKIEGYGGITAGSVAGLNDEKRAVIAIDYRGIVQFYVCVDLKTKGIEKIELADIAANLLDAPAPIYSTAAARAFSVVKPEKAVKTARQITYRFVDFNKGGRRFNNNKELNLEEHLVIMKNMPSDGLLKALKAGGLKTAALSRENPLAKNGWKKMTGISVMTLSKTGEYVKTNVCCRVRNGITEIGFCAKKDFDIDRALEDFVIAIKEGVQTDFKGVKKAVIAEGREIAPSDILNIIKNNFVDNTNYPIKERVLNLFENEIVGDASFFLNMCRQEYDKNGIGVFVLSLRQALDERYKKAIETLRKEGLKFVVRTDDFNILFDGIRFDARGKRYEEIENVLRRLKEAADAANKLNLAGDARANDVRITIETDNILAFAGLDDDISKKYGVRIILSTYEYKFFKENIKYMKWPLNKAEIEFAADASSQEVRNYLGEQDVAAISVSDAGVLSGDIKEEIYKPKNYRQRYDKGYRASLKFDYSADYANEEEFSKLFEAINKDYTKTSDALSLKPLIENVAQNKSLSAESVSYLQYLLDCAINDKDASRYCEAVGFIRGIVMNGAKNEIIKTLALPSRRVQTHIDEEAFKNANEGKYQKAVLTLAVRLKMSGQNIKDLLNDEYFDEENDFQTAQEFLNSILAKVNSDMNALINDNEYEIKEIQSQERIAAAASSFKNFNIILQDKFSKFASVGRHVQTSMLAVRSILSAA